MLLYISTAILLIIDLIAIEMRKSYHSLPTREVKYRAAHGDDLANQLYRVATYGPALEIFLGLIIILSTTGSFFLIYSYSPIWASFIAAAVLLWLVFIWLPVTKTPWLTNPIVRYMSPAVAWIMRYFYPLTKWSGINASIRPNHSKHSHIYDEDDLLTLIKRQKKQEDNRIDPRTLALIKHSLKLQSIKARDMAKPWSKVKIVTSEETIGPILLDELHKSEQQFIPVKNKNEPKRITGLLDMSKLDINLQGRVSSYMDKIVYYLNEGDSLDTALYAFGQSNYPAFIVIDDRSRFIGLLTLQDITSKLISPPSDNAEDYTNLESMASKHMPKEEQVEDQPETP